MKKIVYSLFVAASLMVSCSSSDDSDNTSTDEFSNSPVSGVVYSEDFTIGGGTARSIELNGVDSFYIFLNENAVDCDSDVEDPIWISVPAAVGTYNREDGEMTLQFRDVNGDSFEGTLDGKIEITEITETMVKGKVMAAGFDEEENSINGTFSVQYCPL
ncbi:hypothetical protein GWA97_01505 [Flavobacterium sp. LaA7.5]|nr:hypothetical protein [Flavobacterium salilacus subsp. altitudinum]